MPDIISQQVARDLPSASAESGITREESWKFMKGMRVVRDTEEKDGKRLYCRTTKIAKTFKNMLGDSIAHMGRVTLHKMVIIHVFTGENQYIKYAVVSAEGNQSVDDVLSIPGSVMNFSNPMVMGQKFETELIVPDLFTRQVKPDSANAPMPKLIFEIGGAVEASIVMYYNCDGPSREFTTISSV